MVHEFLVEVIHFRQGEFQHHGLICGLSIQFGQQCSLQQHFGFFLGCTGDINFGFDDRDQASCQDLATNGELLCNDCINAGLIGFFDDRTHLGSEDAFAGTLGQQCIKFGHGLHQLHTIGVVGETFVDLQERNDTFGLPQIVGASLTFDVAVHGAFKKDCTKNAVTAE